MKFALLHSPLVGPTTWRWVASALVADGHDVAVPDLRDAAVRGQPGRVIDAAIAALPSGWSAPVLVGHSGAGPMLPSIAARLPAQPEMVFIDAGLPPCEGSASPGGDFLDQLRALAVDGVLPKWSTWWGEGVMETLVPDADRRWAVEADLPEVPVAFFESAIDVPEGWCETPGAFVLLSESYRGDAERARTMGWRTVERLGSHLDIVSHADEIARTIVDLTR